MQITRIGCVLVAAAALTAATALPAAAMVPQRQTTMTGGQEPDGGDLNGMGEFSWSLDGTRLCYLLTVKRIATPSAAHIHRGRAGVAGDVKVTLETPSPRSSAGCTEVSAALADNLRTHPRRYYVNVHNTPFPAGAVRGQLHR